MSQKRVAKRVKILMLEDNKADAKLALRELALAGFDIQSEIVSTSTQFIQRVQSKKYDLILADYNLPEWSGIEAIRWLRSSELAIPFILVSGTVGDDLAVECIKEGATDYVLKRNLGRLRQAFRRALDEEKLRADRDRAERELRESEEQYRLLFESNPSPMWVCEPQGGAFLAVNETALHQYGFSRDEFLAMTTQDLLAANTSSARPTKSSEMFRGTEILTHKKRDGTLIEVERTCRKLLFRNKEAELVLAHDITELRKSQKDLRQSEERFAKAFRCSPLAMTISTLKDACYLDINDAFLQLLGYTRADIIGRAATELNIWVDRRDRDSMVQQLSETGRVIAFEAQFRTSSGETKLTELSAETIDLDGTPCLLAVTRDITAARQMEEQFRQAQKMEAVGRLAGGVAHDFNNMLGVISGYSEILLDRADAAPVRKSIEEIKKAADRAAGLTRQLLAFSRQQVLQPRVLNLNAVVGNLSKMLRHMIGEDVELILLEDSALGRVKADLVQIEQIIMNLAVNARDAMPQGGKLTIETKNAELHESSTPHLKVRPGHYVLLSASDTGCGIQEKDLPHVFDPFFTTKEPGKGTGLGLSMVYGIVNQSGGYVWVFSKPDKGATFNIYLPRVDEHETAEVIDLGVSVIKGSETILLVEDEASMRKLMVTLLEDNGYTVLEAEGGGQAVAIARDYQGSIEMLVTDVVMPGLSGAELVKNVRKFRPDLRLLYVSGYTNDLIAQHGASGQKVALLSKPFTKHSLLSKIREILGS
jgi:two-component system cell cycle sensor histidine kinase/response regulator CckA